MRTVKGPLEPLPVLRVDDIFDHVAQNNFFLGTILKYPLLYLLVK